MHTLTRSSLFWLFLGGLCYYLALPPVNFAPLAFAVPVFWGIVIGDGRQQTADGSRVSLLAVYLTALLFWLASVYWVAYPCPPLTGFGLLVLSAFLSLYWLLFFVAARVAVHRFHIPLLVAMPVCWIGTEYLRCHILGGFSFCALEHAFYRYPMLIQFESLGGSFLVGGMIMFVGATCLICCELCASSVPFVVKNNNHEAHKNCTKDTKTDRPVKFMTVTPFIFSLFFGVPIFIIIGYVQMCHTEPNDDGVGYSIVALQGNRQVYIDNDMEFATETFRQFVNLTYQTIHDWKQDGTPLPDLIVFPETVCSISALQFEGTITPADLDFPEDAATAWKNAYRDFVEQIETPTIFGLSTYIFKDNPGKPIRLNSALFIQPSNGDEPGKLYRYDKMHLVMFGEYVPFTEYLPDDFFLKTVCPEAEHGTKPAAIPIGQGSEKKMVEASINICFESSVAHLIRNQILALRKAGHDPRVLINLSNDGWFRFSHAMEQHLATHVFRAVENGMWYVTATNGGFSAIISPYGTIEHIGKRGEAEAVAGTIRLFGPQVERSQTV
jgi:apolipoprotein N-acyltransferase